MEPEVIMTEEEIAAKKALEEAGEATTEVTETEGESTDAPADAEAVEIV
ncbi:MAG TPA: hypothetical protein PKZ56_01055 [Candidatus Paceibacterota bacterium]|nr:hypothetical protein [Candidatus Paceibacterota bacterium]